MDRGVLRVHLDVHDVMVHVRALLDVVDLDDVLDDVDLDVLRGVVHEELDVPLRLVLDGLRPGGSRRSAR